MATPVVNLVASLGTKFLNKAAGHGARAARASGEKQVAAQESAKGFGTVSYECVRRIDASIAVGTSHPLYLNFGRAGGKTSVGDEVACYHAAADLGASFTGREFDDASGKPLSVTHPEFYAATTGTVPSNTGSPFARGGGAGIQQAVSDARLQASPAVQTYQQQTGLIPSVATPRAAGPGSGIPNSGLWVAVLAVVALFLGALALGGGRG